MKISIIIPAYNSETVISRCLSSVFNQDLLESDYEVIVVDDGSTDDTYNIIRTMTRGRTNVKILSQTNQKQGAARNNALKHAQGEYIWFVDSDDYIENNSLKKLSALAEKESLDLLCFNRSQILNIKQYSREPRKKSIIIYNTLYTGLDIIKFKSIYCGPCFCLYKKSFMDSNDLRFIEGISYEDNEFMLKAYFYAKRVYYIRDSLYYHDITKPSTTRTKFSQPIFDILISVNTMIKFVENIHNKKTKRLCAHYIIIIFNIAIDRLTQHKAYIIKLFFNKFLKNKAYLIKYMLESGNIKYKIEGILLWLSPKYWVYTKRLLK